MTYSDFERAFSPPRLGRFLLAAKGDQQKVLHLYKLNIQLSECLFGIMSIFEIVLRNHIGQYYRHYFGDNEWLKNQFGFWTYMFSPIQFRVGGQGLHRIYINRPKGTSQSQIFNELDEVRSLRNRIAHHEPVSFDKLHQVYTGHTRAIHSYIIKHIEWLGYTSWELLLGLDETPQILKQVDNLK
ncbi:MAG: hypothetical protein ICV66_13060 [Chitinophagaceae bacterium]|nr:hypothetical protein [Chitinophagaceae bacterium]